MPNGFYFEGTQSFTHRLTLVAGEDIMQSLTFTAKVKTGETWKRGAIVSLDATGALVAGLPAKHAMPLFTPNASDDLDVASSLGSSLEGEVIGYPVSGGFEFATTEFVAGTYAPNALIQAATGGDIGKVTVGTATATGIAVADTVIGIASRGLVVDHYGISALYFWGVYAPGRGA